MARNIEPVTATSGAMPLIAARLCNFPTGSATLLPEHTAWLSGQLKSMLDRSPDAWVDIVAYASHSGSSQFNKALSQRRRDAVHGAIAGTGTKAKIIREEAFGEERSGGGANDNDGFWRAVEVYAYGSLPPGRTPAPPKAPPEPVKDTSDDWYVTNLSLSGGSYIEGIGGGAFDGTITFEHRGGGKTYSVTKSISLAGVGAGASFGLPFLKNASGPAKLLKKFFDNAGFSYADLPSGTRGVCVPNAPVRVRLNAQDFTGSCVVSFVSGNFFAGGGGVYEIDFGLPEGFWTSPSVLLGMLPGGNVTAEVIRSKKGTAFLASGGVGVTLSAGLSANVMVGSIR